MAKVSRKQRCYELFAQGKTPKDPEVTALGLKSNTKWTYFSNWKKEGKPQPSSKDGKPKVKQDGLIKTVRSELEMLGPQQTEESKPETEESKPETEESKPETEESKPGAEESKEKPGGKKHIPAIVGGQGLTFAITISVKTLALYQIAASLQKQNAEDGEEEDLTLGDFLDTCAEDFYRVRGKDLGLVEAGGKI